MNPLLLHKSIFLSVGLGILAIAPLRADLNSDLAFSDFTNVDLNSLANGNVLQQRGGLIYFQRGIITQSLYVVDATPAEVQSKLTHWNPANHSELKVWFHKALPAHPTPADFADLANLPDNSSVNYLRDATAKYSPGSTTLQVSPQEGQIITAAVQGGDAKAGFVNAWSQILAGRFNTFLSGRAASDYYALSGGNIQPIADIRNLIHADAKVYIEFQRLFNQTPIKAGTSTAKALPGNNYWQSFDVEGTAAMVDGALYQAPSGASIQSVDIDFYINSGVYATVELEQMWPVTVNGKAETLVWRDDLVSAPSIEYLHGTERLASGMIMLQDVKQDIDAFKTEFR